MYLIEDNFLLFLTFIIWHELSQALRLSPVEFPLPRVQRLADETVPNPQDFRVTSHLVNQLIFRYFFAHSDFRPGLVLLNDGSKFALKGCVHFWCIQCHLVNITLNAQKINKTFKENLEPPVKRPRYA